MTGRNKRGPLSEPDFSNLLKALSSTNKGRSFLDEYLRRSLPAETLRLIDSLSVIQTTLGTVQDQLQPERIADELRHISMTLDIAIEGVKIDDEGDETARRFALVDRARQELATLSHTLRGEAEASASPERTHQAPVEDR